MSDEEEQVFRRKLEDLRNIDLHSDISVIGKDFREVILRQMELTHALFQRQHQDVLRQVELNRSFFQRQHEDIEQLHASVKQFTVSSRRVEKLTLTLIGLTAVLAAMTFLL